MSPARRFACSMLALGLVAGAAGCFALFPLDEYHEGSIQNEAGAVTIEAGADGGRSEAGTNTRLIFVTNIVYAGNFGDTGGAASGDAICAAAADKAKLAGSFKALLTDADMPAKARIADDAGVARPIVDTAGRTVAPSVAQLFQNGPSVVVSHTETGVVVEAGSGECGGVPTALVWTGSNETGGRGDANPCSNWTSNDTTQNASVGLAQTTGRWLNGSCALACDRQAHLYCLQE